MAISTSIVLKFAGTQVQRGLAAIRRGFATMSSAGKSALSTLMGPAAKLAAMLGPLAVAAGLVKLGTSAISAASDMETLQVQFGALLKSESAATDLIAKLRKLNVESPLGVDDFAKGAKQLLGVRMTADEAADALDKLSNISMGNAENFESLVRAFSQTRSAGRLMGQEVLQYVNAGFNPLNEISLMTGESMRILKKRMEDGAISFDEVSSAITHATAKGGLFNGMNQKIAATTEGKIQKLKDSWNQLLIAFGSPINEHLKPMIDSLTTRASGMMSLARELGEQTGKIGTGIVNAFNNGDLWNTISTGFLAATSAVGEKLIAAFIYGGTIISNAIKDGLRGVDLGFLGGVKVKDNTSMSWAESSEAARNALNSEGNRNAFNQVIARNQTALVDYSNPANRTGTSTTAQAAEWMKQAVSELKGINQKLAPQP